MKRSGFAAKHPRRAPRQWDGDRLPSPRATVVVPALALTVEPLPKECALQHRGYETAVRRIACRRCWTLAIKRQFCHADILPRSRWHISFASTRMTRSTASRTSDRGSYAKGSRLRPSTRRAKSGR